MNRSKMAWGVLLIALAGALPLLAQDIARPEVLPWDGRPAAFTLTFDDGDPSHLDVAVPELDKRGLKGTFFLIVNQIVREDEWRKLPAEGHEIGNHSLDHKHAKDLDAEGEKSQVSGARNVLQKKFGIPILTFAYPFVEITPGLKDWARKTQLLARGGGWGRDPVLLPGSDPDWMDLPSRTTMTDLPPSTYDQWIDEGMKRGGWTIFMIHGLEGTVNGWQPIPRKTFTGILDRLQKSGAWVGTFLEVGAYFRAQKAFEASKTESKADGTQWTWEVPEGMPAGTSLWVRFQVPPGKELEVQQDQEKLVPRSDGSYRILFSKGKLEADFRIEADPSKD